MDFIPFEMDFDGVLTEFSWIWVDFFVGWWCNPSIKRQHHDTTNDETTKQQNNETTNGETTKRRRPSVFFPKARRNARLTFE